MKKRNQGLTMLEVMIASVILVFVVAMVFLIMSNATTQANNESANMVMQEKAQKLIEDITSELRMADVTSLHKYPNVVGTLPIVNDTFADLTNGNVLTPVDPLSGPPYALTVLAKAKCPIIPTITTNYERYAQIEFDTMTSDSGGTGGAPVNSFDFTNTKPKYGRHVIYTQAFDVAQYVGQVVETRNGVDDNKNGMVDERVLWKQSYANFPPPVPLPAATRVAYNLRGVAFEIPTGTPKNRVIIHVMFQDVDSKGKLIWYYTNSTVAVRN